MVTVDATVPVATPDEDGQFTFTRDDPANALEVTYDVSGSAAPGVDYAALPGTVTFEPGHTTATVDVDHLAATQPQTVTVSVTDGAGYTVGSPGQATVVVSPGPLPPPPSGGTPGGTPQVSVTAADHTFTFTRTGSTDAEMPVAYDVTGTAQPGTDYTELPEQVTIPAGAATVDVPVAELDGATAGATVVVTVVDGESYDVGSPSEATVTLTGGEEPPPGENTVERAAGSDRIGTAVALSQWSFDSAASAEASERAFGTASSAVLATAGDFPDALAASTLAAEVDGPILLTPADGLDERVADELQRLGVTSVYLAGGTAVLSDQVEEDLAALGITATRVAGPERNATAVAIADQVVALGGPVEDVLLAVNNDFPDALAAGNVATHGRVPILLTEANDLPGVTSDALEALVADGGEVVVVGGTNAVSADVEAAVNDLGLTTRRIAGANRLETGLALVEEAIARGASREPTILASAGNYPDALAAVPAAFHAGGVVILVHPDGLAEGAIGDYLAAHADEIDTALLAGGPAALSEGLDAEAMSAIAAESEG